MGFEILLQFSWAVVPELEIHQGVFMRLGSLHFSGLVLLTKEGLELVRAWIELLEEGWFEEEELGTKKGSTYLFFFSLFLFSYKLRKAFVIKKKKGECAIVCVICRVRKIRESIFFHSSSSRRIVERFSVIFAILIEVARVVIAFDILVLCNFISYFLGQ